MVSTEDGQKLAESWGCAFQECSAKADENIGAQDVYQRRRRIGIHRASI
jgi:hypothetical protein